MTVEASSLPVRNRVRKQKVNYPSKRTFYMLWSPAGASPPTKRFAKMEMAEHAAARMSKKYKQKFYVMQSVCRFTPDGDDASRERW